jgi:hypothetical protein
MLSLQKHKEFMKQLGLVDIKKMMNDANWDALWENRVVTNIKEIRCAKTDFSSVRSLDAAAFQSCKHFNIWSEFQHLFMKQFQAYLTTSTWSIDDWAVRLILVQLSYSKAEKVC